MANEFIARRGLLVPSGNVGIGTISPSYPLSVYSTSNARIGIDGTTNFSALQINNSGGTFYFGIDDSVGANFTGTSYGRFLYSSGAFPISFFTNATEKMRITSAGNVGIGTTSPSDKLEVAGAARFTGSGGRSVVINGTSVGRIDINGDGSTYATGILFNSQLGGTALSGIWNFGSGTSQQWLALGGTAYNNSAMYILPSGNVGIGTTSPDTFANGGLTLGTSSSGKSLILNSSSNGSNGLIQFKDLNGNDALQIAAGSSDIFFYGYGNRPMLFYTNGSERMRILSGGNIAIGKTTAATILDVNGTITATSFSGAGTGLTGTASSLSIGGTAASETLATVTTRGFITRASSGAFASASQDVPGLEVYGAGSTQPAFMTFHRPGAYAIKLGLDGSELKVGGWSMGAVAYVILHSGNYTSYSPSLTGSGASGTWGITSNYSNNITQSFNSNWNSDFQAAPAGSTILRGDTSTGSSTGGPGATWWFQQNMRHANASNYWGVQVAWGWEDNANILRTRNVTSGSFGSWVTYLNSNNYGGYSPTLTGGGASGTWGINITGNASNITAYSINQNLSTTSGPTFGDVYNNGWFRNYGTTGVYNQTYGSHFRVSTNASHGTWETFGYSKNGYAGLNIIDSSGYWNNHMFEGGNGGVYQENGAGWLWYYNRTYGSFTIGGATVSGSYKLYVEGSIYATGVVDWASDVRKKENIITLDSPLEKITKLRGVYFNRIDDPKKKIQTGVIAQEVKEVIPELVNYDDMNDSYSVSYGNFAGLFIEAIKEQQTQIENLKQEIEILKNK